LHASDNGLVKVINLIPDSAVGVSGASSPPVVVVVVMVVVVAVVVVIVAVVAHCSKQ